MSQYLTEVLIEQRNGAMNQLAQAEASNRVLIAEVCRLNELLNENMLKESGDGADGSS